MHKGDMVKMNSNYCVPADKQGVVFEVVTEPEVVCGTEVVFLKGFASCYATDGLDVVNEEV